MTKITNIVLLCILAGIITAMIYLAVADNAYWAGRQRVFVTVNPERENDSILLLRFCLKDLDGDSILIEPDNTDVRPIFTTTDNSSNSTYGELVSLKTLEISWLSLAENKSYKSFCILKDASTNSDKNDKFDYTINVKTLKGGKFLLTDNKSAKNVSFHADEFNPPAKLMNVLQADAFAKKYGEDIGVEIHKDDESEFIDIFYDSYGGDHTVIQGLDIKPELKATPSLFESVFKGVPAHFDISTGYINKKETKTRALDALTEISIDFNNAELVKALQEQKAWSDRYVLKIYLEHKEVKKITIGNTEVSTILKYYSVTSKRSP
ncbi:MAG: hypothetical protein ACO1N9_02720 [Flavobacterium sp.]